MNASVLAGEGHAANRNAKASRLFIYHPRRFICPWSAAYAVSILQDTSFLR